MDSGSGITTKYYYDLIGRAMKYTETKSGYSHSVEYAYDTQNNLSAQTEIINGTEHNTTYTYDKDNRVTSKVTDNIGVYYTYDSFGRLTQQVTKSGNETVQTKSYTYMAVSEGSTSTQIATYSISADGYSVTYTYTYDDNGNIISINDGFTTLSYQYDSANQVIRENNPQDDFTRIWTYDNAGNILTAQEHDYSIGELADHRNTVNYTYDDSDWGDKLTAYNDAAITYDQIGNPLSYRGNILNWEHGRELSTLYDGNDLWTYTYDSNGMRTSRTDGQTTYTYIYNGSQLSQMTVDGHTLSFTYDAKGIPLTVTMDGTVYYYITNIQGDVVGLQNANGDKELIYEYDAWGKLLYTNNPDSPIAINPLRYRGYVYDSETGLYYVSSRYYDPEIGRWINADGQLSGVGEELLGYNLFAYCFNNPVNMGDPSGNWPKWLSGALNVLGGVAQMAAGAALGAFASWTGIGAVAAGLLIVNGAAATVQGVGQIVNYVTKSNVMREDNIVRTGVQEVGRVIGGDSGSKVAGGVYDVTVAVANIYAGKVNLQQAGILPIKVNINNVVNNPLDEFVTIGPADGVIEQYCRTIPRSGYGKIYATQLGNGLYQIANGHHRVAALRALAYETIKIYLTK